MRRYGLIIGLIAFSLILILATGCWDKRPAKSQESVKAEGTQKELDIYFYLSEKPLLNREVRLVTTIIPNKDMGTGSVRLILPEGMTLVESANLTWAGELKRDEFIQIPAKIRLTKPGRWKIETEVKVKEVLKKADLTIETTKKDVSLSSEGAEYIINPLPPEKCVYVEIRRSDYDKILKGKYDLYDNYYMDGKIYTEFITRAFFNPLPVDKEKKTLSISKAPNKIYPEPENVILISNTFWGYDQKERRGGGGGAYFEMADIIPFSMPYPINSYQFTCGKPIHLVNVYSDGSIKFNYSKYKGVVLKPEDSWKTKEIEIIDFKSEKGKRLRVEFTNTVTITNYGIFCKIYRDEEKDEK